MAVDIEGLLRRVVADVLDGEADATYSRHGRGHDHSAEVHSRNGTQRRAVLLATYEWSTASFPDLGVGVILFEYDDDEHEKETQLRDLALLARAFLRGEGRVEYTRGLLGKRPLLTIESNDQVWRIGRRTSWVKPAD